MIAKFSNITNGNKLDNHKPIHEKNYSGIKTTVNQVISELHDLDISRLVSTLDFVGAFNTVCESYSIQFIVGFDTMDSNYDYASVGIIQSYIDENGLITVELFDDFWDIVYNDTTYGEFLKVLKNILSHELVHITQLIKSSGKMKYVDISDSILYLSNIHEIEAHAAQAMDYYVEMGYNKRQIKQLLRNPNNGNIPSPQESNAFWKYYDLFYGSDDTVWKKFVKYCYYYIDNNINESLQFKKKSEYPGYSYKFIDNGMEIGTVFVDLKRGWNRLHISINDNWQGKGYATEVISKIIENLGYICIAEGRIINDNVYKVIDKLIKSDRFRYFKTEYDEHIFTKSDYPFDEIIKKFGLENISEIVESKDTITIVPNRLIYHSSNPYYRKQISKQGLIPKHGEGWLADDNIKGNAIFAFNGQTNDKVAHRVVKTDSFGEIPSYDSGYDDDIWIIDTAKYHHPWYIDTNMYSNSNNFIYTRYPIPIQAITLAYKGTGEALD